MVVGFVILIGFGVVVGWITVLARKPSQNAWAGPTLSGGLKPSELKPTQAINFIIPSTATGQIWDLGLGVAPARYFSIRGPKDEIARIDLTSGAITFGPGASPDEQARQAWWLLARYARLRPCSDLNERD